MIRKFLAGAFALALITSCSGNTKTAEQADATPVQAETPSLTGEWTIESIVFSDSDYVRPAEIDPEAEQFAVFNDSAYVFKTNCNTLFGPCTVAGDSITLGAGGMTRMMCENVDVENALVRIMPEIVTYTFENDSVARLNSADAAQYIVLRKLTLAPTE